MAIYQTQITTPWTKQRAFQYMAHFDNAAEWDPGVRSARALQEQLAVGAAFELDVEVGRRTSPFRYEITELNEPHRVVLRAQTSLFTSVDTITVADLGTNGSRVTYQADLRLRGPLSLLDPVLSLGFRRIADRAVAGLRARLESQSVAA